MADLCRKTLAVLGITSGFVLVWFILIEGSQVLLVGFAGILLAVLLRGLSDFLSRKAGIREGLALLLVITGLLAAVALTLWLRAGEISEQVHMLFSQLPDALASLKSRFAENPVVQDIAGYLPGMDSILSSHGNLLLKITGVFSGALSFFSGILLIFVISVFLAANPELYIRGVLRLIPPYKRSRGRDILTSTGTTLKNWLLGKLALMMFVGIATYIGLALLGVPLTLTLAVLAGLLDFVPNFGPVIAAIPAALIALLQSPRSALWVLVLYFAVQVAENYVLTPVVQRKVVKLAPALTITVQILLGALLGLLGMVFAIPLTAAAVVLIRELYIRDALGDQGGGS
ncbi:MAG TPA: AI-2E family transporter [Bryobacteraceae bacterium]|nr:AI-2E family transporter [Bryobacteraceae bacterium]